MCECEKLRRNRHGVEDHLLLIEGVANTLLSLAADAGDYETVFHFLGSTLSDYRDLIFAELFEKDDDKAADTPKPATAEAEAVL
jgi:hypothetical protein